MSECYEELSSALVYLINKALYSVSGITGVAISRLAAKFMLDYLHSQNFLDKADFNEEQLKDIFINKLKIAEDLSITENNGTVTLHVKNPILNSAIKHLLNEKIPIIIHPAIIYVFLVAQLNNYKVKFQEVNYKEDENIAVWTFKKIN
ncbi:hypothetical protein ACO3VM_09320 [Methanocaldococcus sp. 10A]